MFQILQNSNLSPLITLQTLPSYHSILGNHKSLVLIYINFISFQLNSRPLHLTWTSNHSTCTKPTFHILHKVNSFSSRCDLYYWYFILPDNWTPFILNSSFPSWPSNGWISPKKMLLIHLSNILSDNSFSKMEWIMQHVIFTICDLQIFVSST